MALSQMMQHYLQTKERYKDSILFYRLGDFYEMFFDDAKLVSRLLELTLTGKDCGLEERASMCGIPFHAANTYIAKLVGLGYKVAICEQLEDPALAKGLVDRDVIRIVSAGTLIEDTLLDESKNNFLCCAFKNLDSVAVSWVDITTGEFNVTEFIGKDCVQLAVGQLLKISAAEIICNDEMLLESKEVKEVKHNLLPSFSSYVAWAFNVKHAENKLLEQFGTLSLTAFGIAGKENCIASAGALIEYLNETQKHSLSNITSIQYICNEKFMMLDSIAIKNLELTHTNAENKKYGSLIWLLDKTKTGMGARLLTQFVLSPLGNLKEIDARLDGVEELCNNSVVRMNLADVLRGVKDIERLSGKISNGNLMPRDCLALCSSLNAIPALKMPLTGFSSAILKDINENLFELRDVVSLLTRSISEDAPALLKDGGYIKKGYNAQLDEFRDIKNNGKSILAQLEAREKEETKIPKLKIGFNRVFGYFIEVSNSYKNMVPDRYIRRQTLTTGERFITPELKELEEKILNSEDGALKIEAELYSQIKEYLLKNIAKMQKISKAVALLDVLVSFATISKENKYCRPKMVDYGEGLQIIEGRHPVIEALSKERFIPNDCIMDSNENRTMIITGPNMAGKSTYMRQVAIIVLMAHIGCFVPAKSATIPLCDRIFTRVGASDNLIFSQSTFMVEMTEVASILQNATKNSLLILDEVGRGTSTFDGLSIAWAVIEFLTEKIRPKTLFATHYHELTELEGKIEGIKNYKVTVKELNGAIVFLRKIMRGGANRSFGVEVASLAGVPKEITSRATCILKNLEKNDIARTPIEKIDCDSKEVETEPTTNLIEIENILKDTNLDTLSPMQALLLLSDLKEKIK